VLTAARKALVDIGAIAGTDPLPPFAARMSGNLGLTFHLPDGAFVLVKVGLMTRLDREYRGLVAAHGAMPLNVPEPLRIAMYDAYQVLVTRGVAHEVLLPLQSAAAMNTFEHGIEMFLDTSARAFRRTGRGTSWDRLDDALVQAGSMVAWPGRQAYGQRIRRYADTLAPILQHGDFAANNIGVHDGTLIFFDWEDFAEIDLPGFDLAVLLLSLSDFSFARIVAALRTASLQARIVHRGCALWNIAAPDFLYLFPAYAALYIETKSRLGYPAKVTERIAGMLAEWISIMPADGDDRSPVLRIDEAPSASGRPRAAR